MNETDHFNFAFEYLMNNEGVFSNDPSDPGGATKYGITRQTLSRWRNRPVSIAEVLALTVDEAAKIYQAYYWRELQCQLMTQKPVAVSIFDSGVLFGTGVVALHAQISARQCGFPDLSVDGRIGHRTIAALNCVDSKRFIETFCLMLRRRIDEIIGAHAASAKFRTGWLTRIDHYLALASDQALG